MNISEFFSMGGYALYVWSSVGISAIVMLLTLWSARRRHASALVHAKRRAAGDDE